MKAKRENKKLNFSIETKWQEEEIVESAAVAAAEHTRCLMETTKEPFSRSTFAVCDMHSDMQSAV